MRLSHAHQIGKSEAADRIDRNFESLVRDSLSGVTVQGVSRSWSDGQMTFSVQARWAFLKFTVNGTVTVSENEVALECNAPVSENALKLAFDRKMDELLQPAT